MGATSSLLGSQEPTDRGTLPPGSGQPLRACQRPMATSSVRTRSPDSHSGACWPRSGLQPQVLWVSPRTPTCERETQCSSSVQEAPETPCTARLAPSATISSPKVRLTLPCPHTKTPSPGPVGWCPLGCAAPCAILNTAPTHQPHPRAVPPKRLLKTSFQKVQSVA